MKLQSIAEFKNLNFAEFPENVCKSYVFQDNTTL